jgi:hypothetical protein
MLFLFRLSSRGGSRQSSMRRLDSQDDSEPFALHTKTTAIRRQHLGPPTMSLVVDPLHGGRQRPSFRVSRPPGGETIRDRAAPLAL